MQDCVFCLGRKNPGEQQSNQGTKGRGSYPQIVGLIAACCFPYRSPPLGRQVPQGFMSKHKSLVSVSVCLLAIAMLWLFIPAGAPKTDTARYERWQQTSRLSGRAHWWEWHLPKSIDKLLRLSAREQRYWDEHEKIGDTLTASGYLTNIMITVTTVPTNTVQHLHVMAQLNRTFQGRPEWEFWVSRVSHQKHAIIVECRPQDEAICRQALEE